MKHPRGFGWAFWVSVFVVGSGCSSGGGDNTFVATVVPGSMTVTDDTRAVSGFTRVAYSSEGAVHVEQGATESLRIRADDNLHQYLTSVVRGGRLELRTAPNVDLMPTQTIQWFLTVKSLEGLDVGGIGSVTVSNLTTGRLVLDCSGITDVAVSNLSATELEADLGGFAKLHVSGDVDLQTVRLAASGFGDYDAENLQSREARVTVHGQPDATVRVSDLLVATITSSGWVYYYGNPTVQSTITGTGEVERLDADAPAVPILVGSPPFAPCVTRIPRGTALTGW